MKYSYLLIVLLSFNAYAAKICQDSKSKLMEEDHKHIFYPSALIGIEDENTKDMDEDLNLFDFGGVQTTMRLELVGFERYRGGEKVLRDLEKARVQFERVVASSAFRSKILKHRYNNRYSFKLNNRKSNSQIFQSIIDGADKYNRTIDNEIDMILCPYYTSDNVIGYTYSKRKEVWVNLKYYRDGYNNFSISDMVGNFMHEWIHNAGFGHDFDWNETRSLTVPYAVGYMARSVASKLD